jgi:hypothetical protein
MNNKNLIVVAELDSACSFTDCVCNSTETELQELVRFWAKQLGNVCSDGLVVSPFREYSQRSLAYRLDKELTQLESWAKDALEEEVSIPPGETVSAVRRLKEVALCMAKEGLITLQ